MVGYEIVFIFFGRPFVDAALKARSVLWGLGRVAARGHSPLVCTWIILLSIFKLFSLVLQIDPRAYCVAMIPEIGIWWPFFNTFYYLSHSLFINPFSIFQFWQTLIQLLQAWITRIASSQWQREKDLTRKIFPLMINWLLWLKKKKKNYTTPSPN